MTISHDIRAVWEEDPAADAIVFEGAWYPRRAFAEAAAELETLLRGIPRASSIGLVARNRVGPVVALVALLGIGRPVTMIYSAQSLPGIAADIAALDCAAVLADPADWTEETLESARKADSIAIAIAGRGGAIALSVVHAAGSAEGRAPRTVADDVAIELLSSGTTGTPKRIPLNATAFEQAALDAQAIYGAAEARPPPTVMFHPISNISGLTFLIPMIFLGQRICLMERFSLPDWIDLVRQHRPWRASLPPAVLRQLLDSDVSPDLFAGFVSIGAGAAVLDPGTQARFEQRFGVPILISYGATEFCGIVANWTLDLHRRFIHDKRGSVGRARPGVSLRIADPDSGADLPAGQRGLLEAQVDRLGPAWQRTTDLASLDDDGFLFLHGRADGAINRGGFKVIPEHVAEVLRQFPAIQDAAVIGREDGRLGMVPVAAVEAAPGSTAKVEDLVAFARERLLAYQVPAEIRIVDALPRNASLKVDLVALRAMLAEPS